MNKPSGDLSGMDMDDIEIAAKWEGEPGIFYKAIIDTKWLVNGCLNDWEEHNPYAAGAEQRHLASKKGGCFKAGRKCIECDVECGNNPKFKDSYAIGKGKHDSACAPSPLPSPSPLPKDKRFKKPSLEEVSEYCKERNKGVDPQKWMNHYEANGWRVGKNPMKNWKAAVRTWEGNSFNTPQASEQSDMDKAEIRRHQDAIARAKENWEFIDDAEKERRNGNIAYHKGEIKKLEG
jgi:hypothetical protein